MSFTFNDDLSDDVSKVRSVTGDIDAANPFLPDETIKAVIAERGNVRASAIECVRRIIAKIARDYDRNAPGLTASRSQRMQHFKDLLAELKVEYATLAAPVMTGGSLGEAELYDTESDYRPPNFDIGMDDMP